MKSIFDPLNWERIEDGSIRLSNTCISFVLKFLFICAHGICRKRICQNYWDVFMVNVDLIFFLQHSCMYVENISAWKTFLIPCATVPQIYVNIHLLHLLSCRTVALWFYILAPNHNATDPVKQKSCNLRRRFFCALWEYISPLSNSPQTNLFYSLIVDIFYYQPVYFIYLYQ
jgi:hypothetical protein